MSSQWPLLLLVILTLSVSPVRLRVHECTNGTQLMAQCRNNNIIRTQCKVIPNKLLSN